MIRVKDSYPLLVPNMSHLSSLGCTVDLKTKVPTMLIYSIWLLWFLVVFLERKTCPDTSKWIFVVDVSLL